MRHAAPIRGLRESETVNRDFRQVIERGQPVTRCVVAGGAIGHLDDKAAGPIDQERQEVMGGDEVRIDSEAEYSETLVDVELPDWSIPLTGTALQLLGFPDVVDQNVDVAVMVRSCAARAFTWAESRWSTTAGIPVPPRRVTSSAVSSMVSPRL